MPLKRCPDCGAEYIDVVARCADCGVLLVSTASEDPEELEGGAREPRGHHHDDDDEVDFDLNDWTTDERALLDGRLTEAGIPHRWEGGGGDRDRYLLAPQPPWEQHAVLVVRDEHADAVDEILDDVEYPDALDPVLDDGAEDEANYQIMSDLYVAADRLKNSPSDAEAAADLGAAQEAAAKSSIPFGVEIRVWEQVQDLARSIAEAADIGADDDAVSADAARLRDILSRFV